MAFLYYYAAVGLFAAGMQFGLMLAERSNAEWREVIGIILTGLLWPLLVLYILLYDKYNR